MNFVESIFGISPDGGSALFEWSLLLIPLLGFMATAVPCFLTLRKYLASARINCRKG
jgi:hypothetical protein